MKMINLIYRTLQIADMQQDIKATLIGSRNNILKKNETIIDVNHLWVLSFPNVIPYPIKKKQEAPILPRHRIQAIYLNMKGKIKCR